METVDNTVAKLGYYSALTSFIAAFGYSVVQILQVIGWIFYPVDDILIYAFSLCIASPFMLSMLALHYSVAPEKKIWSHAALLFAVMYSTYVTLMYGVQLCTVIPASPHHHDLNNILTVTPHSFFWTIDALGYIFMGVSTLFAASVFKKVGLERWLRYFFVANGLMVPVIAFVYFCPHFSTSVLFLGFPWGITAPGSILLLAIFIKKKL